MLVVFLSFKPLSLQYYVSDDVVSAPVYSYQLYDCSGHYDKEHNGAIDNRAKSYRRDHRNTTVPDDQCDRDQTFYSYWNCYIDHYFVNPVYIIKYHYEHNKFSISAYAIQCRQLHRGSERTGCVFGSVQPSARRKRRPSSQDTFEER